MYIPKLQILRWILIARCLTQTFTAVAEVNVAVVIAEQRGGTGDITSNILAAMQLKKLNPDWNITLVGPFSGNSRELVESVLPQSERELLLPGIEFYSREDFALKKKGKSGGVNIALQFSTNAQIPMSVESWADAQAYFFEYSIADDNPDWKKALSFNSSKKKFTTGPANLGLYIGKEKSIPIQDRESTMAGLSAVKEKTVFAASKSSSSPQLAYCYATDYFNSLKYVQFVYHAARTRLAKDAVRVVVYDANPGNAEFYNANKPKNVELVVLHQRPLSLGFGLIAHADLPVLLTGDFGPTIAIEYEKPFFLETHPHKEKFRDDLKEKFAAQLSKKDAAILRKVFDFSKLKDTDRELINNTAFWPKFSDAIADFRGKMSLIANISSQVKRYANPLTKCRFDKLK